MKTSSECGHSSLSLFWCDSACTDGSFTPLFTCAREHRPQGWLSAAPGLGTTGVFASGRCYTWRFQRIGSGPNSVPDASDVAPRVSRGGGRLWQRVAGAAAATARCESRELGLRTRVQHCAAQRDLR
jgi:hypothetical protein